MKKNVLIALAISAMSLVACKKEEPEDPKISEPEVEETETTPQSPIPLKVGNQWVYNVYAVRYDTLGKTISETLKQIDTLTILRKEVANKQEYYVVNSCLTCGTPKPNTPTEEFIRVENGRLVGPKFKTNYSIHTSSEPLDSFSLDSFIVYSYYVHIYEGSITLPTGNFENVIESNGEMYFYDSSNQEYIRNKKMDSKTLYSPLVGILSDKVNFYSGVGYRRELISYKLN